MIFSPDKQNKMDGSVLRIAGHIQQVCSLPIVPITRIEDFVFNDGIAGLRNYVLLDYSELHWNTQNTDTHLFGKNTKEFLDIFRGDEWLKFDEWIRDNPPIAYFKRELKKKDAGGNVYPIDYPCWASPFPLESREQFNERPVNVHYYWGRSHEDRVQLHGDIWKHSSKNGAAICDNIFYFQKFMEEEKSTNKWVTLNMPHYARIDISNIFSINGMSKLSVSMPGSGIKCFRNSESPVNSVMIFPQDDLAWGYEWENEINCIRFSGEPIPAIEEALQRKDLYDIYVKGHETIDKYRIDNYVNNYIQPIIQQCLTV